MAVNWSVIRWAIPAKLFWQLLLGGPHFPCSLIAWTTVFCIGSGSKLQPKKILICDNAYSPHKLLVILDAITHKWWCLTIMNSIILIYALLLVNMLSKTTSVSLHDSSWKYSYLKSDPVSNLLNIHILNVYCCINKKFDFILDIQLMRRKKANKNHDTITVFSLWIFSLLLVL